MKLIGIELKNFRSIGDRPVILTPLNKCNILVGQNNVGKSNVLRAVKRISDKYQQGGENISLDDLEYHNRTLEKPFIFKLWFEGDKASTYDGELEKLTGASRYWFEILWEKGKAPAVVDHTFTATDNFSLANGLLQRFASKHFIQHVIKR